MFDNCKKTKQNKTKIFLIVYKKWACVQSSRYFYCWFIHSWKDIHHLCFCGFVFFKENEICHICRKEFEACEEQYPCRICDKVFHKDCVLSLKELHPSHLTAIKRANTSVGWSCPECVRFSIYKAFILWLFS